MSPDVPWSAFGLAVLVEAVTPKCVKDEAYRNINRFGDPTQRLSLETRGLIVVLHVRFCFLTIVFLNTAVRAQVHQVLPP